MRTGNSNGITLVFMTAAVGLLLAGGGCPLDGSSAAKRWSGAPALKGTWAMADVEGGGVLGMFTVDESGQVAQICYVWELLQYGANSVPADGTPIEVSPQVVARVTMHVAEDDGQVIGELDATVTAGGAVVGTASGYFGGERTSADAGFGSFAVRMMELNQEVVNYSEVVLKRLSDDWSLCLADDAFEPDDEAPQAVALAPGEYDHLRLLNSDWYQIEVPEGQSVIVRVGYDWRFGDIELHVYDTAGSALLISSQAGDDYQELTLSHAGTYQLLVDPEPDQINPDYTLSIVPFTTFSGGAETGMTLEDLLRLRDELLGGAEGGRTPGGT